MLYDLMFQLCNRLRSSENSTNDETEFLNLCNLSSFEKIHRKISPTLLLQLVQSISNLSHEAFILFKEFNILKKNNHISNISRSISDNFDFSFNHFIMLSFIEMLFQIMFGFRLFGEWIIIPRYASFFFYSERSVLFHNVKHFNKADLYIFFKTKMCFCNSF